MKRKLTGNHIITVMKPNVPMITWLPRVQQVSQSRNCPLGQDPGVQPQHSRLVAQVGGEWVKVGEFPPSARTRHSELTPGPAHGIEPHGSHPCEIY